MNSGTYREPVRSIPKVKSLSLTKVTPIKEKEYVKYRRIPSTDRFNDKYSRAWLCSVLSIIAR